MNIYALNLKTLKYTKQTLMKFKGEIAFTNYTSHHPLTQTRAQWTGHSRDKLCKNYRKKTHSLQTRNNEHYLTLLVNESVKTQELHTEAESYLVSSMIPQVRTLETSCPWASDTCQSKALWR